MTKPCGVDACRDPFLARGYCKRHYRRFMKYGDPEYVVPRDKKPAKLGNRVCNKCHTEKPLEEFHKNSKSSEGRTRECKTCLNQYRATWNRENAARTKVTRRRNLVRSKYGDDGLILQHKIEAGAVCEACGEKRNRMAIDHNHKSGAIRGILCSNCNTALGLLAEDFDRFTALMDYLRKHQMADDL